MSYIFQKELQFSVRKTTVPMGPRMITDQLAGHFTTYWEIVEISGGLPGLDFCLEPGGGETHLTRHLKKIFWFWTWIIPGTSCILNPELKYWPWVWIALQTLYRLVCFSIFRGKAPQYQYVGILLNFLVFIFCLLQFLLVLAKLRFYKTWHIDRVVQDSHWVIMTLTGPMTALIVN